MSSRHCKFKGMVLILAHSCKGPLGCIISQWRLTAGAGVRLRSTFQTRKQRERSWAEPGSGFYNQGPGEEASVTSKVDTSHGEPPLKKMHPILGTRLPAHEGSALTVQTTGATLGRVQVSSLSPCHSSQRSVCLFLNEESEAQKLVQQ